MTPSPLDLLHAAIRCDMAYMEPTWMGGNAQCRVAIVDGIQRYTIAGTNDKVDVLNDVKFAWVTRTGLGVVRDGFADAWRPIRHTDPAHLGLRVSLPVVMEAHSLGAPISQYEASRLIERGFDVLGGIGFGSPTGFDKHGGVIPNVPWAHVKNGYDPVAGRPWWWPWGGITGGKWWQIEGGEIREGMKHPIKKPLLFWRAADDHRLRGKRGYIYQLGAMCDAAGMTQDWRRLPEALDWARAVAAFNDRGSRPQVVVL